MNINGIKGACAFKYKENKQKQRKPRKNIGKPRTLFANDTPAQTIPPIFIRQEPKSFEKSTN